MDIRIKLFKEKFVNDELIIATNAQEAIDILKKDLSFDLYLLDHDLGNRVFVNTTDENTGSRVAEFLSDKDVKGKIIIHSWNPAGAKNMLRFLPQAIYRPFSAI